MDHNKYDSVDARPVKSFFVHMLTRDIALVDAILDLLDNCIDGILRQKGEGKGPTPYEGFEAEIKFDSTSFSISDNCGGIPWELHEYAFRMGKEDENRDSDLPTVGVYGIGMKRAIFKIGKRCLISTQHEVDCYEVEITPDWIAQPDKWRLPVKPSAQTNQEDGTDIVIDELNEGIRNHFDDNKKEFTRELTEKVRTHYAYILDKGFRVIINGKQIPGKPTRLIFATAEDEKGTDNGIKPYVFQAEYDEVKVFLSVGFTRPIPSQAVVVDEREEKRYSSMDAGWTILCNDRAVLYCDRTELTGWGEAGVPRYHTQFIAISGIVEFRCNDAAKLPTTTTKRGIDATSSLYLQVKNRMREGMQIFTNYTNKWKGDAREAQRHMDNGTPHTLEEIKTQSRNLPMNAVRTGLKGEQFKPKLPLPKPDQSSKKTVSYKKEIDEIEIVQGYLFGEKRVSASQVGEKCFDLILTEAK